MHFYYSVLDLEAGIICIIEFFFPATFVNINYNHYINSWKAWLLCHDIPISGLSNKSKMAAAELRAAGLIIFRRRHFHRSFWIPFATNVLRVAPLDTSKRPCWPRGVWYADSSARNRRRIRTDGKQFERNTKRAGKFWIIKYEATQKL